MLRLSCAALAALAAAACASVPEAAAPAGSGEVAPPQLSEATMKEVTRTLSLDEFEGRAPGTPGEEKTLAYLVRQFERVGLQPGNDGSWFQDVPLVEITASRHEPLRIAGPNGNSGYAHAADWVGVTYREEPRIDLDASEIVFVGYGINAPEKGWNDYAGIDMRGKTALILVNDPDYEQEGLTGPFNGRAMTYYGRWTYKFEEAARQGAAAALIVHDTFPASYGWNVVESSWTGPQAYAQRANGGADQTQVNGWVQKPVAEAITSAAGRDFAQLTAAAKRPGFRPVPLGVTASTGFDNAIRRFQSKNVIGMLPGRERPNEYVLHTAQWDHDVDLAGRRVAVIGTGASAIQVVPAIQPEVGHLDLYQRSAPWVLPKGDHPFTEAQRRRFRRFPVLLRAIRAKLDQWFERHHLRPRVVASSRTAPCWRPSAAAASAHSRCRAGPWTRC